MTDARNTQIALEQWGGGDPAGRLTQVAVEQWAATTAGTVQALATQVALEMWVQEAAAAPTGRPRRIQNVNYY